MWRCVFWGERFSYTTHRCCSSLYDVCVLMGVLCTVVHPNKWFVKLMDLGIVDNSRTGLIIVNDLRPKGQRLKYDMVLSQSGKKGMGFAKRK